MLEASPNELQVPLARSKLISSTPSALTSFKILRQTPDHSPQPIADRHLPLMRELDDVARTQNKLHTYLKDIDDKIDGAFQSHESRVKARHLKILQITRELKKAFELAQAHYEQLYQEYSNSNTILILKREIDMAAGFFAELQIFNERISEQMTSNRDKIKTRKQQYLQKKKLLHSKCHENLALVAQIIRTKNALKAKQAQTVNKKRPQMPLSPMKSPIHSPNYALHKVKRQTLKPLESIDIKDYSKLLSTDVTSTLSARSGRVGTTNELHPILPSRHPSSPFLDEAAMIRREIREVQQENRKMRIDLFTKCSESIELGKLHAEALSGFEKLLQKTQSASSHGMQGTLLFVLLDEINKKPYSEFGPSKLTLSNFNRHSVKPFAKLGEGEAKDVAYNTFKKIAKFESYKDEDRLNSLIAHLNAQMVENFHPMQIFGLLFIKQKVYEKFQNLFLGKTRFVTQLAAENKLIVPK